MDNLHQKNIDEEILALLEEKVSLSIRQIVEELNISGAICSIRLKKLVDDKKIIEVQAKNSGKKYYFLSKKLTCEELDNLHDVFFKDVVDTKDIYEELNVKIERVDNNVNSIYANIISIMSIFVAIFALITINANIAFELTQENICYVFYGIIGINIFVVICIIAMLVGIRVILINTLLGKRKDKNAKRG